MQSSDIINYGYQVNTISDMAEEMSQIFTSMEQEDVEYVLNKMVCYIKKQMLKGNEVRIPKIGTFKKRLRPECTKKNLFGEMQTKPEMWEAYFETNKTLRRFINGSKR